MSRRSAEILYIACCGHDQSIEALVKYKGNKHEKIPKFFCVGVNKIQPETGTHALYDMIRFPAELALLQITQNTVALLPRSVSRAWAIA